jgi:predicted transcriptional regulator
MNSCSVCKFEGQSNIYEKGKRCNFCTKYDVKLNGNSKVILSVKNVNDLQKVLIENKELHSIKDQNEKYDEEIQRLKDQIDKLKDRIKDFINDCDKIYSY